MLDTLQGHRKIILIGFALVIITTLVYWQVKEFDFVTLDDPEYITENSNVTTGINLKNIKWAFSTTHAGNWHPLTWLSLMMDVQFFGMNPSGFHITNLFFHLINTILLFLILHYMTHALWRSAFVAALFALHPLHVESVAWISERKDVLSTLFLMLTLAGYAYYVKKPEWPRYIIALVFFALGLMAKPMLVTLPFALLLLDYWPLKRLQFESEGHREKNVSKLSRNKKKEKMKFPPKGHEGERRKIPSDVISIKATISSLLLEKVPFFMLSAASCVVTFLAQREAMSSFQVIPLATRIENAFTSYVSYLGKMIWPQNLAIFYAHPKMYPLWQAAGALIILGAITFFAVRFTKRFSYVIIGWLWYLGTLVPVVGLVQVGSQAMADRYTYIPSIGIFIIMAWGSCELLKKSHYSKKILASTALAIVFLLTAVTWFQLRYWKNSFSLFEHAIVIEDSSLSRECLGNALRSIGKNDEALSQYYKALTLNPNNGAVHYNLGLMLAKQGKVDEAKSHYYAALKIRPNFSDAHNNLGLLFASHGDPDKAAFHYQESMRMKPDAENVHFNYANLLMAQGKINEALFHYYETLKINPNFEKAHNNLGMLFMSQGKINEAARHFTEAIRINPNLASAWNNLGLVLIRQGNIPGAVDHFRRALQIKPDYVDAHYNLGATLHMAGKIDESIFHFQKALSLDPGNERIRKALGYAKTNRR